MFLFTILMAICLLALGPVLADDQQTLMMAHPIDELLFRDTGPATGHGTRLWRLIAALILEFCWAVRVFLVPAFGLIGTTYALQAAESAFDVVLNSVAIGFVFEADDSARPPAKRLGHPAKGGLMHAIVSRRFGRMQCSTRR